MEIGWMGLRKTPQGRAAADLVISAGGTTVKYRVYLRSNIRLAFHSADRNLAAARLLRLAGGGAEVRKGGDVWYVYAADMHGRKELRDALAEIVRTAVENGLDEKKAEGWLEKLEDGRVLREGWPRYSVWLTSDGALVVIFSSD